MAFIAQTSLQGRRRMMTWVRYLLDSSEQTPRSLDAAMR
jgi:hypothetical protein